MNLRTNEKYNFNSTWRENNLPRCFQCSFHRAPRDYLSRLRENASFAFIIRRFLQDVRNGHGPVPSPEVTRADGRRVKAGQRVTDLGHSSTNGFIVN